MASSSSRKQRRRVVWDEENLNYLETHRTPKQKIMEPKTPYHTLSLDPEDAAALSPVYPASGSESEGKESSGRQVGVTFADQMDSSSSLRNEASFSLGEDCGSGRGEVSQEEGDSSGSKEASAAAASGGNDQSGAPNPEALQSALSAVASRGGGARRGSDWQTSSEDEGGEREGFAEWNEKDPSRMAMDDDQDSYYGQSGSWTRESFREQRRKHYDEFRKVKALRAGDKLHDGETEVGMNGKE